MENIKNEIEQYLKIAGEFRLGQLATEGFHPLTENLSSEVHEDLDKAISSLKAVDKMALDKLLGSFDEIFQLHEQVQNTLSAGSKN